MPGAGLKRLTACTRVAAGRAGLEAAVLGFAVTARATAGIASVGALGQPSGGLGISRGLRVV